MSCARASRMRIPAVRTSGLTRWASATRRSSIGSLKFRHHSSICAFGLPRCSAASESSEPLDQPASQGTSGRLKSGPTAVQLPEQQRGGEGGQARSERAGETPPHRLR